MSSVNFNVGLSNERSSSRVLKPPGGGHTDIFNVKEPAPEQNNKGGAPTATNKGGAVGATAAEPKPEAQQKAARVPPGGFSSGLW